MSKTALTPRQKQILNLILAGKVNKEIAQELNLAHSTILNVSARAFRKLGINDTRQLFPMIDRVRELIAE